MAAKKTAKKTVAKEETVVAKAPAKTVAATKAAPAKKAPAKTAAATSAKTKYTAEQVYSMIEQAAYFAALNDGFSKDAGTYWTQAEKEINAMVNG